MKRIKLTQNKNALVDDEDFDFLSQWKWTLRNGYAARSIYLGGGRKNQKSKSIYMHRLVRKVPSTLEVDHINGNKLDNRKVNLRKVTSSQNKCNRPLQRNNSSGLRGVIWNKQRGKWMAQIKSKNQYHYLGLFTEKKDAALAYNKKAVEFFGNFARPNL